MIESIKIGQSGLLVMHLCTCATLGDIHGIFHFVGLLWMWRREALHLGTLLGKYDMVNELKSTRHMTKSLILSKNNKFHAN